MTFILFAATLIHITAILSRSVFTVVVKCSNYRRFHCKQRGRYHGNRDAKLTTSNCCIQQTFFQYNNNVCRLLRLKERASHFRTTCNNTTNVFSLHLDIYTNMLLPSFSRSLSPNVFTFRAKMHHTRNFGLFILLFPLRFKSVSFFMRAFLSAIRRQYFQHVFSKRRQRMGG